VFSSTRTLALDPKNAKRRAHRHASNGTEAPAGAVAEVGAYFSPSWTAFQADRGRDFSVIVDGVSV
jgi:hypothetical protein